MPHNLTQNFTLSYWMKHEHHPGQSKHVKEHLLCNADDHREYQHFLCFFFLFFFFLFFFFNFLFLKDDNGESKIKIPKPVPLFQYLTVYFCTEMNRHHFALFVRNCRLILLLRREFGDGDLKSFRPAEFRWKLPQVLCALPLSKQANDIFI